MCDLSFLYGSFMEDYLHDVDFVCICSKIGARILQFASLAQDDSFGLCHYNCLVE